MQYKVARKVTARNGYMRFALLGVRIVKFRLFVVGFVSETAFPIRQKGQ
jgi:hypothetical protein